MDFLTSSSELFKGINTLENTIAKVQRQVETVLEEIDRQLSNDQTRHNSGEDGRNHKIYKDRLKSDLRCFVMSFPQMCHLISSIAEGFRHIHPEMKWEARKEENDALDVVIKLEPDRDRDNHDDAVFEMLQVTPELGETDEEMHEYNQPNRRSSSRHRRQTQESGSMKQLKNLLHRPIQKTKKNHSPTSDAGNSKEANLQRNETPASSDNAHNIDNHDNVNELKSESESETNEVEELSGDESSDFEFEIIDFGSAKFPSPKHEHLENKNFPVPKQEDSGNNNETMKDYRDEYEKCGHCTSTFRNKHQLRQHVMMIHPRSYFKEYGKSEETEEEWIKFMNITQNGTVDKEYPYKCPICDKPSRQKKIVLEHIPSHCGISEQKLTCPECKNTYKTPMSLRAHLRHQHPTRLSNTQQQQQQQHPSIPIPTTTTSHSDNNNAQSSLKSVHCPICGQVLSSRYNLKQHMLRHDGSKPFVCPYPGCGKTFRQQGSVRNHVEGIHSVTEKYVCKMCDKKFRWRRCYDIHVQTHNENRVKLLCTFCSKEFLCDQYLQNHIASVHLKLRSYPCHLCEKSFAHKSNLVYHLNTHERDKNKLSNKGVSLVGQV